MTGCTQDAAQKTLAFCWLGRPIQIYPILFEAFKHDFVEIETRDWPMLAFYPLNQFCSKTSRTQNTAQKTFAFCWLGLFKHILFDLKHSSMILLMSWPILIHCILKKILVQYSLKEYCSTTGRMQEVKGKTVAKLLIRFIQIYLNWFEAFEHDFVDRE